MAKTLLNSGSRNAMRSFAKKNVEAPTEKAALEKRYRRAVELINPIIAKKYPASDMEVLKKYDVAEADTCIEGGSPDGRHVRFEFLDADAPVVPSGYCSGRRFEFTAAAVEAINKHGAAKIAYEKAVEAKLEAYERLITGSRYFEDVVAIWPAVETLRSAIIKQPTALAVLSDETIKMIRRDNAGHQLQASA